MFIFDFYKNFQKETFELRLNPGKYNENTIVDEIQNKINGELNKKGLKSDMLKVQIGGVASGTAVDDLNKLVIKYESEDDGRDNRGNYIIDGVRGSAAYTVFYRARGEPSPTHTVGIVDLARGAVIETGVNDTFIMDINGKEKVLFWKKGNIQQKDFSQL